MYGDEKRAQMIAASAIFVALIAIGGWISIPVLMIPFTMQNFFMLLAAAVMKRYAIIPVGLYVLLGTIGLPIFHNGTAGIGILLGPTGGFLIGFVLMAGVVGLLFEKQSVTFDILAFVVFGAGSYIAATSWFMLSTGSSLIAAFVTCVVPFVIGDVIKSVIIEAIILRLRKSGTKLL